MMAKTAPRQITAERNILNELAVARPPFEDQNGSNQRDQEPRRVKPPSDFQRSRDRIAVGRPGLLQGSIGNNPIVEQQQGEQKQEDYACNGAPDRLLLE
jgi:hypothetical protein